MPVIHYDQPGRERRSIDVPLGQSLMRAAVDGGVDGIVGECGGARMCATCHVYIDLDGIAVSEISDDEDELLDFAASPRADNSRLSCQVLATDEMDGLVVAIPERQT